MYFCDGVLCIMFARLLIVAGFDWAMTLGVLWRITPLNNPKQQCEDKHCCPACSRSLALYLARGGFNPLCLCIKTGVQTFWRLPACNLSYEWIFRSFPTTQQPKKPRRVHASFTTFCFGNESFIESSFTEHAFERLEGDGDLKCFPFLIYHE